MTDHLVDRIWARDHRAWQDDPTEVADRLGWLDCPSSMQPRIPEFIDLARSVRDDGIDRVLLIGMGGSSLYPEVLASAFPEAGGLRLSVLDSTHPAAVARARAAVDPARTLLVAASKSGTTVETRSHLERFWADLVDVHGDGAGRHVVAITDPGSDLARLGVDRGFRAVVTNPPDIGGRFSALSAFGLVPAALIGLDVARHLDVAAAMAERCRAADPDGNPGLRLGVAMADAALAGRYQLTLRLPEPLRAFGGWVEQLVAESTGKHGLGVLPVVDERSGGDPGAARLVVAYGDTDVDGDVPVVRLPDVAADDLAAEVFRWEFATAVAGARLGINPFDQPDVQAAKSAATRVLLAGDTPPDPVVPAALLDGILPNGYVALLAFVDPAGDTATSLPAIAGGLRDRLGVPVTVGIGPRYLHSTGQFHKGGPDRGVFLVVLEEAGDDVAVPGEDHSFGQLLRAQAVGDLEALSQAGRRAGRVTADALRDLAGVGGPYPSVDPSG